MNIKLHTPKSLQSGSGLSSTKQFLLSLIATTVSIVLTFGTAALIDYFKKESAKKEMVMMVISDFDKTIEAVEKTDTVLRKSMRLQMELANHPELYDSLRYSFLPVMKLIFEDFSETTEKIFTSSIETFNTIGNVNFVNEVSSFYLTRRKYNEIVLDTLKKELDYNQITQSLKSVMSVDFSDYVYDNRVFLEDFKEYRNKCMQMMKVSEEDLRKFSERQKIEVINPEKEALIQDLINECDSCDAMIKQAKKKLGI